MRNLILAVLVLDAASSAGAQVSIRDSSFPGRPALSARPFGSGLFVPEKQPVLRVGEPAGSSPRASETACGIRIRKADPDYDKRMAVVLPKHADSGMARTTPCASLR